NTRLTRGGPLRQRSASASNQAGIDISGCEIRLAQAANNKPQVRFDRPYAYRRRALLAQKIHRTCSRIGVGDHLRDHWVVKWRDLVALFHCCVEARRQTPMIEVDQPTGAWE